MKTTADSLSGLRAEIEARLATFAKSSDIGTAIAPLSTKLSGLQDDVRGVLDSEEARKTTAQRIVLSLDLADLKRVIERGKPYAAELEHVRGAASGSVDLAPLDRFANQGVPTLAELRQDFKSVAYKLIDTEEQPTDGSIMGRLLSGAKSVVRVRKINHSADDKTVEAIVSRMEAALNEDRLGRRAAGGAYAAAAGTRQRARLPRQGRSALRGRQGAADRRGATQVFARGTRCRGRRGATLKGPLCCG